MTEPLGQVAPTKLQRFRFSIGLLMTITFMIAADIALVQAVWKRYEWSPAYVSMVAPMANALFLCLPRLRKAGDDRRFWLGFELVGWAMIVILGYMDRHAKQILFYPLIKLDAIAGFPVNSPGQIALGFVGCVVFYLPLQLLTAWFGGWLATLPSRSRRIEPR